MIAKMILVAIAETAFVLALVLGTRKSRIGPRVACGMIAAVSLVSLFLGIPGLAVQGLATLVALVIYVMLRSKSAYWAAALFVPVFAVYGLCALFLAATEAMDLSFAHALVQRVSTLREKYPLESVVDRLAYETRIGHRTVRDLESDARTRQLTPDVDHRLSTVENRQAEIDPNRRRSRRAMLASLHTRTNEQFVEASGFGRMRMIDPGAVYATGLELPESSPIPVPSEPAESCDPEYESAIPMVDREAGEQRLPAKEELLGMHDSGMDDFVDPDRIGFVKDKGHVAGFQSHRFTKTPDLPTPKTESPRQWKIARLELVSLLKHETPVAYISRNLPQMDELRHAPTRPLDAFERQSLDTLRTDEDVVIDETTDRIRMVGSLRAAKTCLDCHSVRRGELLGALTYELVPARPTRKRAAPISPPTL